MDCWATGFTAFSLRIPDTVKASIKQLIAEYRGRRRALPNTGEHHEVMAHTTAGVLALLLAASVHLKGRRARDRCAFMAEHFIRIACDGPGVQQMITETFGDEHLISRCELSEGGNPCRCFQAVRDVDPAGLTPQAFVVQTLKKLFLHHDGCQTCYAFAAQTVQWVDEHVFEGVLTRAATQDPLESKPFNRGLKRHSPIDEDFRKAVTTNVKRQKLANSAWKYMKSKGGEGSRVDGWDAKELLSYQACAWEAAKQQRTVTLALDGKRLGTPAEATLVSAAHVDTFKGSFLVWNPPTAPR